MAEEMNMKKSDIMVDSGETVAEVVSKHSSMKKKDKKKKKKKHRETKDASAGEDGDLIDRDREKLGEDAVVKKKSKKQRIDSEIETDDGVKKSKNKNKETMVDSEAEDGGLKEKSKKRNKNTVVDAEAEDSGVKEKSKKRNKNTVVDAEAEDGGVKEKKNKETMVGSDVEDGVKKKKKSKKESEVDVIGNSESSKVDKQPLLGTDDANRKRDESDFGAEENTGDKEIKRKRKKKKPSVDSEADENNKDSVRDADKAEQNVDSEVEETSFKSTKDLHKESKLSEDAEVEENNKDSVKDAKKQKKKKKKAKQSVDSEVEDVNLKSTENAKKKSKEKKRTEDPEGEENETTKDSKRKQSEVSEVEKNNNDSTKEAKKKRKRKCSEGDKDEATPSSKSTKRVKFSDQVEIFPTEDEENEEEEEEEEEEVKVVKGKRYTKEEDELIKASVLEYIDNHALGDEGIKMVMDCKSNPQTKGCWKEITSAIPWRTYDSVYNRAHTLFEEGSRGEWSKEDMQLVIDFQKKHGNDWRTLADAMGKHRKHVKDAWRRIRLESKNKGHWTREEYQKLFDLVNKDLRMKAFQEKHSKHGMLRDNIPWMAISDKLETRDHVTCCGKWYDQLQSPMISKGIWANVDDYRLLEELLKLDAACIDDVDWDDLLDNRDGEACRKRWNQMVLHIGSPGSKTFAEQVEILSKRYCPDLAEDREDFDNRPYDPEEQVLKHR